MLVVETIARIRRDHLVKGVPIKKIARDLRVSKNTVRKVVRGDETSFSYARKIQPMPKLGPWVSHGGECAFDRVGGAQMLPMLGGKVVERQHRLAILDQAGGRLVVLDA